MNRSSFDQAEASAKEVGSDEGVKSVTQSCPSWKIRVTVKSKVDYWPGEDVRVWLSLRSGSTQFSDKFTKMISTTAPPVEFSGRGPQRYEARASTGSHNWSFAEKEVEVTSKDVDVVLEIEPQKWAAIKIVDAKTKKRIEGVKSTLALGADATSKVLTSIAPDGDPNAELSFLTREGPSKITKLELDRDEVWEVVSVTSE